MKIQNIGCSSRILFILFSKSKYQIKIFKELGAKQLFVVCFRKHPGRCRWAVIVCMTPAAWADKESIRLKKKAYRELRMTSHWPSQAIRLLPENLPEKAACEKRPLKDLPLVAKTTEAMQLAGVVPYRKNLTRLLEKGASGGAVGGAALRPRWSPDYQPPEDSFDPDNSWVGIAVFCGVVSLLSALVYGLVYASAK